MSEPARAALPVWSAPVHSSRCGSAHRRRGVPCQDSARTAQVSSADGLPVQLMAVADGHGGERYWLSAVGSDLACRIALSSAAAALADLELLTSAQAREQERLLAWLSRELPELIVRRWLQAAAEHWQSGAAAPRGEGAFSAIPYGTTLGLVLLTPLWWAQTGLGDWDLVLIEGRKRARIVSEESAPAGGGEATASLCLPEAARLFAERTAVYPLGRPGESLALVLSTDGIRKSCATDGDHLKLCSFLVAVAANGETEQLDPSLDRISGDGSGDDVTVAVALWPAPAPLASLPCPAPAWLWPGRAVLLFAASTLLLAGGLALKPVDWNGLSTQLPLPIRTKPARSLPPPSPAPDPAALGLEVQRLCRQPALITPTLNQRKALFRRLLRDPQQAAAILRSGDATGALIVASRPDRADQQTPPKRIPPTCPALNQALQRHWQSAAANP